ncbi:rubredoxin-like domain-containing protein [Veillonella agrestimuris]|uniref:rubredoxin-like domain-containing protein n=1 Tax=Veillonella agrestimuris TaxID=2941340 RepID=UPI00203E55EA|nr:hypothetical protein [Veillonella agrestimuris]
MTAEKQAAAAATTSNPAKPMNKEQATKWVICRVCGYIEEATKRDEACPACGYPATVWMDYTPRRIDPKRDKLLDLHLHPIAVHFPIVATTGTFLVPIIALLIPSIATTLFHAVTLAAMILPILAIIGGISGYIGSKLRYKTATAKIPKLKIYLTIAYFILSCIQSYVAFTQGVNTENAWVMIVLGVIGSVMAGRLGKMGSYLFAGRFSPYTAG